MLRLTPCVRQPPPSGLFTVVELVVLPTNTVPLVNLPEIVLDVTDAYVTASFAPVDVLPLFHLTDPLAVPGFEYAMSCPQFNLSVSLASTVRTPLVIPGVPEQPESVPFAVRVWATLTVGDTGGDNVSVPTSDVHVNTVAAPPGDDVGDEADVVDPAGAELLDEELLEHAGRNTAIAITVAVVTKGCRRTRVTSEPAKMGRAPYIAAGTSLRPSTSGSPSRSGADLRVIGRGCGDLNPGPLDWSVRDLTRRAPRWGYVPRRRVLPRASVRFVQALNPDQKTDELCPMDSDRFALVTTAQVLLRCGVDDALAMLELRTRYSCSEVDAAAAVSAAHVLARSGKDPTRPTRWATDARVGSPPTH